jgi:CheY-like chemotaxis protein
VNLSTSVSNLLADGARPTVVLADDHVPMLEMVSQVLASHFDVVAAVTDGRQAIAATLRHDPDVVVLDISMPELDGIQAALALKRMNSRAKVVFTTMHDADELVRAGIAAGACGYVQKNRTHDDLTSAIGHGLSGRIFVPSLSSLSAIDGGAVHAVRFHEQSYLRGLSEFLGAALRRGDVVAIFATAATCTGLEQEWIRRGVDFAEAANAGRYLARDAADVSLLLRTGDGPDVLDRTLEDLERRRVATDQSGLGHVTAYGEVAPLLLRDGHAEAAIQLERQWHDWTRGRPFLTVCGYPIDMFDQARPEVFAGVCAEHQAVCHAGYLA